MKSIDLREMALWCNPTIQKILKLRSEDSEDVEIKEILENIKNSKVGFIEISKESPNPGYFLQNEGISGVTAAFGEGIACWISGNKDLFYTSTIDKIDWDNGKFYTQNSVYKFTFNERDYNEIIEHFKPTNQAFTVYERENN